MGWANRITVTRGVLTVLVWVLVGAAEGAGAGAWLLALAVFAVTALGDIVDGAIARRLGEVSVFGRIADPLVDKLLVLGTLSVLLPMPGVRTALPTWVALVVLVRELLVTVLRAAIEASGGNFQAAFWGKIKMATQCVMLGAVMAWQSAHPAFAWLDARPAVLHGTPVVALFAWVAATVTAISCFDYAARGWRMLRGG